jgi:general secretion pathway protein H
MRLPVSHSAARRRPSARFRERGMTLLEIGIALLIVALMIFVAVPSIEAYAGVRAREEAGRISGAIRYLYGQSALSGKVCRIVFDMDERTWWTECTEGRFTVEREKERSRGGQRVEEKKKPAKPEQPPQPKDEVEAMRLKVEHQAEFSEFKDDQVTKRTLPDGANVAVWVGHQREKYTKGKAFLYFFPQGNTERAQIYVSSDHGDIYTLVVSPLNGRVRVDDKELDVPRD